jgi:hypothetical protein
MVIFGPDGAASAEDCRPIIVKEGYLTQAQFECDFADLSEALADASRKCGDGIGKDAVGEALKEEMEAAMAEVDKGTPPPGARAFLSAFRTTSSNEREISEQINRNSIHLPQLGLTPSPTTIIPDETQSNCFDLRNVAG